MWDYELTRALNGLSGRNELLDWIVVRIAESGIPLAVAALAAFCWALLSRRLEAATALVAGVVGAAAAWSLNQMIAELWARPRPFIDHSDAVKPLFSQASDASFPSDHATASSALAAAVTVVTPRGGVALWIIALSIASARVVAGVHYVSDVLVGLGVGLVFGGGVAHTAIRLGVIRRHAADVSRS